MKNTDATLNGSATYFFLARGKDQERLRRVRGFFP